MIDGLDTAKIALLFLVGAAAGFVNVNAGGGSLLTLPCLLFLGVPATAANATNRVGIALQNVAASSAFRHKRRLPWALGLKLLIPAVPGAILGARFALDLDDTAFRRILAAILVMVLIAILRRPKASPTTDAAEHPPHPVLLYLSFLGIGIYAGVIQAGAGFIIMAALTRFGGLDLIRTNAVKVFVVLFLQLVALVVFQAAGEVRWALGLCLGLGTMVGGWIGAHVQIRHGEQWVRRFLIACVLAIALKLLVDSF